MAGVFTWALSRGEKARGHDVLGVFTALTRCPLITSSFVKAEKSPRGVYAPAFQDYNPTPRKHLLSFIPPNQGKKESFGPPSSASVVKVVNARNPSHTRESNVSDGLCCFN